MARKLTRAAALENRAFLKLLRRTGNVRLACRELGLKYGTMQHRRRVHAAFAARWDAAVVFAQAGLMKTYAKEGLGHASESRDHVGRARLPSGSPPRRPAGAVSSHNDARSAPLTLCSAATFRTAGGEPVLVRLKSGRLQLRRAQPGKLTPAAEQAFLAAVSATCNLSLAAAAVGACFNAFNRRRKRDPAFAREVRLALKAGYAALEEALLESGLAGSHEHDDWRSNDPPATPPMTVGQALQLMHLHQKAVLLMDEPARVKRRRGEGVLAHRERLLALAEARLRRERERFEVAEVERWAAGEPPAGPAGEAVRRELGLTDSFGLPDLAQVAPASWSRADPTKTPHDPNRALFGGWRIAEMEAQLRARRNGSG